MLSGIRHVLAALIALSLSAQAWAALPCELLLRDRIPINVTHAPLSKLTKAKPSWTRMESNSDQRQPLYLGASPRELALGLAPATQPRLQAELRTLGTTQALAIRAALGEAQDTALEFEAWPVQNDQGQLTWVFARVRRGPSLDWEWLEGDTLELAAPADGTPAPILPQLKKTWLKKDFKALFTDILKMKDLYAKPLFGDAVWLTADSSRVIAAWLPVELLEAFRSELESRPDSRLVSRILPQPARFNEEPVTFVIEARESEVRFPEKIEWISRRAPVGAEPPPQNGAAVVASWPEDFNAAYANDIRILSGRKAAEFPLSHRKMTFKRKNSIDPNNQLEDLVDYLEERYRQLGVRTIRQRFLWRGVPQSNLIAIIPGTLRGAANKPILLADHIDTAFSEDAYEKTGKRISAPGADDNNTATAALLRAAEVLKDSRPAHDLWLAHLTGEEFPADDLGARALVAGLLEQGKDIGGLVLMDMIGYRKQADRVFQINAGDNEASLHMAAIALASARRLAANWQPTFRDRFDPRSYLYNTDGIVFSNAGYPVILLNEHINGIENLNRPHYHSTSDTVKFLDFNYAATIARVAIETAARLAKGR